MSACCEERRAEDLVRQSRSALCRRHCPSPRRITTRWNSGDKQSGSGAIGWHLTVNELLGAMATYRRRGTIVAAWRAQRMLEDGIGLDFDFRRDTRLGTLYAKGGWWRSDEGKVEQSNAFFLPRGMELVVLANSPLCHPDTNFMGNVSDAINDSIELWIASIASNVLGRIEAGG